MLNWIFVLLILGSVITAAFTGTMSQVTAASIDGAKAAVTLAIGLVGQMALWLGFMGVLREAGLMKAIGRGLAPIMRRLFPDVPADHPAMGAMIMNLAANILGLGNAATPFGLKAMNELDKLNRHKGVATNAMALFLAINTSGVAVLALGAVAIRATLGSHDPAGILVPSLLATTASTVAAVIVAKFTERLPMYAAERYATEPASEVEVAAPVEIAGLSRAEELARAGVSATGFQQVFVFCGIGAIAVAFGWNLFHVPASMPKLDVMRAMMSDWLLPLLMSAIVLIGLGRKVKVYEVFVASAKEGFQIGVTIIPFLVAILVSIGMFRASGAMEAITSALGHFTSQIGFPAEALPMALIRPLSGSGALGVMTETMKAHGPDSFIGYLVSVLNGSSETTFYVLAVYFGAVQVRAARHTVIACLAADFVGVVAATVVCHAFFG